MKTSILGAAAALSALAAAGPPSPAPAPLLARDTGAAAERADDVRRTQDVIREWPRYAQDLAASIMQEYGAPDEIALSQLRWNDRKPYKRVVVFRDARSVDRPDGLLESVAYEMPLRRASALEAFGHGVSYDPFLHELVSRAEDEPADRLALNLADEVIRERRSVAEAVAFYDKTMSLSFSGKLSPYMSGLLFEPSARTSAPLPAEGEKTPGIERAR